MLALRSGTVLVDPSYAELAAALGFATEPEAGATTLRSSAPARPDSRPRCTARPKGWRRWSIDAELPGGQAGTSSRIRNYLGFPTGLSGRDLTNRALEQAWFFGARLVLSRRATALSAAPAPIRASSSTAGAS